MIFLQRHIILLATASIVIVTLLFATYSPAVRETSATVLESLGVSPTKPVRQLYLLVPATAANFDFCKFLLSSTVAQYPEPILIGWGGHGEFDGAKSHLFKITETVAFFKTLDESHDDDLVLLLDAYDIWLILRPDVMISRYFDVVEQSNRPLQESGIHGKFHGGSDVRNTLFWGPDKFCWPFGYERAACWAVPNVPMHKKAFGPDTDSWAVPMRPRWLNSGTLMGPLKDMRDMFDATLAMVRRNYEEDYKYHDSDQYYFQDVWAEQEVGRTILRNGSIYAPVVYTDHTTGWQLYGKVPDIPKDQRTEYHIAIDYNSSLFQTASGYNEYMTWMSFNHSTSSTHVERSTKQRLDQLQLPADILSSSPPFSASSGSDGLPTNRGWKDVILGVNQITKSVFPLFHVTGDKGIRDRWWHHMWFHPHGEALLAASRKKSALEDDEVIATNIKSATWKGPDMGRGRYPVTRRGGAWTDQGQRLEWDDMCKQYEDKLFLR